MEIAEFTIEMDGPYGLLYEKYPTTKLSSWSLFHTKQTGKWVEAVARVGGEK